MRRNAPRHHFGTKMILWWWPWRSPPPHPPLSAAVAPPPYWNPLYTSFYCNILLIQFNVYFNHHLHKSCTSVLCWVTSFACAHGFPLVLRTVCAQGLTPCVFSDTKHRAASLRQPSFTFLNAVGLTADRNTRNPQTLYLFRRRCWKWLCWIF